MFSLANKPTLNYIKKCYIASRMSTKLDDYGNEIPTYSKAKAYRFSIMPASGEWDIATYGDRVSYIYKAVVDKNIYANKIKEGDLAYLHGVTPDGETEDTYGSKANYVVNKVVYQNVVMQVHFEKLQK